MPDLDWLTARPIAHRGLHDAAAGIVENTASAFAAAMAGDYGIECDVQVSADGEAMVHHDDALGRLTEGSAPLANLDAAALKQVAFKTTADRMLTLSELCELVSGRVPLVVEIKSRFDGDLRLTRRVADVLGRYKGPAAAMSFDPEPVATLRETAPALTRGIVAERHYRHHEWDALSAATKRNLAFLLHAPRTRPHFVAWSVKNLPALAPLVARTIFGRPLLTWTVRSAEDRATAARYADQMIFEGFRAP
ncbi:glycerophosphodiester phosphodiesterase family protein [Undibacter mobilis]|uniref:Glycerophosphodiester phosphodiesterase n=1 Tax=Undibacter mobilis TaxID=2292256 RepID=A0A371BD87_9BRAD|nr:glycerophosphodiester phosphodiesterase family protein [Undibacter mobilis]RDV05520.1 glycerophosphodiester phosphodiesterase [Undibacter mobilis]